VLAAHKRSAPQASWDKAEDLAGRHRAKYCPVTCRQQLFADDDGGGQLEDVLASMPLRVWRSDEVTPPRRTRMTRHGKPRRLDHPQPEPGRKPWSS